MVSELDFKKANYTAVISDLHLCEAELEPRRHPYWKKFKTDEFFFDEDFKQFVEFISKKGQARDSKASVELILNGDIFDFDSVTSSPTDSLFRVSPIERWRGLFPQTEKSVYKIQRIIEDHPIFFDSLSKFVSQGHRVVFVIGNHDAEVHYEEVQNEILNRIVKTHAEKSLVRFVEWFYISNSDTLIEHGNQYDPYCLFEDPINPFVQRYNYISMKLPFGNLACRYIMNGMGFFNPHAEANYIMTLKEYCVFFVKYLVRVQPLLVWTWLWGAIATLAHASVDRFAHSIKNPLLIEDRLEEIAQKANASPRIVRQLKELFAAPASNNPILLARELWLDRAFIAFAIVLLVFSVLLMFKVLYGVSLFWALIPLVLVLPLFVIYSKSVRSLASEYKEPDDRILQMESEITGVRRVIYGHTHQVRHEFRGPIEHLNSGTWSPAFKDVACTIPLEQRTFIWISTEDSETPDERIAQVFKFKGHTIERV